MIYKLIVNYFTYIINFGTGIVLLPFLLGNVSIQEVNIWFIIWTLYSVSMLFEIGLQSSGTSALSATFNTDMEGRIFLNKDLFAKISNSYNYICAAQIIIFFPLSFLYISITKIESLSTLMISWSICFMASIFQLATNKHIVFFRSIKQIEITNYNTIMMRVIFLIGSITVLLIGYGVIGVAVVQLVSVVATRVYLYFAYLATFKKIHDARGSNYNYETKSFYHQSIQVGIMQLSGILAQRSPILIGSILLTDKIAAQLSLATTLLLFIQTLSCSNVNYLMPHISKSWSNKNKRDLINYIKSSYLLSVILFVAIALAPILSIDIIQTYISELDRATFLSFYKILCIYYLIEIFNIVPSSILVAMRTERFAVRAVITALLSIIIAYVSFSHSNFILYLQLMLLMQFSVNSLYWNSRLYNNIRSVN